MSLRSGFPRATAAAVVLLLLGGCGSSGRAHRSGAPDTGPGALTGGQTAGPTAAAGSSSGPGARPGQGTLTSSGQGSGQSGGQPTDLGGTGGAPARNGTVTVRPGKTVDIGVQYISAGGGAAAAAAIGTKGISSGDEQSAFQILFDAINAQGGLGGHKIRPVWATYDPAGSDPAQQEQQMCAAFTQDAKVVAALLVPTASDTARTCLTKKGVAVLNRGLGAIVDDQVFRSYPMFGTTGTLSLNRMADVYVDGLAAQGYFGSNPKIGLITADEPSFVRTSDGPLRRALKRHGLSVALEQRVPISYTVTAYGNAAPALQNAVLKFSSANVTHVLFLQPTGASALLFMTSADSQSYTPRYGMSTNDQLMNIAGQAPARQLARAVAVGWYPTSDVPISTHPVSAAGKKCLALLASKGNQPGAQSPTAGILGVCDQVAVLAAAARVGGLGGASTIRGLEHIGTLPSSAYLGLSYVGNRRDGVSQAAGAEFHSNCTCFVYNSKRFTP